MSTLAPYVPGPMAPQGATQDFEPLPPWTNGWRLLTIWLLGAAALATYVVPIVGLADRHQELSDLVVPVLMLDFALGQFALVLAAFRRRAPVSIAFATMAMGSVSAFAGTVAFLPALSLATRRRPAPIVWLGVLSVVAVIVYDDLIVSRIMPAPFNTSLTNQGWWVDTAVMSLIFGLLYVVVVLVGWNIGSRRELVASWRRQAETASSEQAARVAQAQLAERARIAREMHDVLAHRLSLVAMHAGVLAHRTDLSDQERGEAAEIIRAGAHQALEELREVLGVLRESGDGSTEEGARRAEAPQPGLSGIPALVAEVTSSGQEVRLLADDALWPRSVSLPTSTGRHAYRVVQEALTNARKHAGGAPVTVRMAGGPKEGLTIEVANPTEAVEEGTLPSGGRGLTGMAERVELAGGRFEAGMEIDRFVVRAWLPWTREKKR